MKQAVKSKKERSFDRFLFYPIFYFIRRRNQEMIFTHYTEVQDFAADVLETIKKHEIQNNLLLLNINNGLESRDNSNMVMATVKDERGKILLTAIRTAPFPMVLYETDNIRNDAAVGFFAGSLVENKIDIDLFMTEKALARSFCERYGAMTSKHFDNNMNMVLYILKELKNPSLPALPSGGFRKANENDMYYLPYWYADFIPACHLGDYDLQGGMENAKRAIESGTAYIWEDGVPVSLAASVRRTSDCIFIGSVYTPPNFRGKGYSTACVWNLTQSLLDEGFDCCALYADCANPYSNKVYQKIGYKESFYYDQYIWKEQ